MDVSCLYRLHTVDTLPSEGEAFRATWLSTSNRCLISKQPFCIYLYSWPLQTLPYFKDLNKDHRGPLQLLNHCLLSMLSKLQPEYISQQSSH